ncbi:MAG TPA: metallophosphoesterase [Bacteroidales bacterium]|nr:metallophosphoesterase [Bacteroidales bacterium]
MNLFIRIFVLSLVIVVSDIYFYRLLKNIFIRNEKNRKILKIVVILLSLLFILFEGGCYLVVGAPMDDPVKYRQLFVPLSAFILLYVPKAIAALFLILHDLICYISSMFHRHKSLRKEKKRQRWVYITALMLLLTILGFCIDGFVFEKTHLKIQKVELQFSKLPDAFEGFKIVQISDIHLGTFTDTKTIEKFIENIRQLSPDMLVMTGDMINVTEKELYPYYACFRSIKPPYGKYAILGNHDIGDYFKMKELPNQAEISKNLIQGEKDMGFTVLIDSACYIKKGGDSIALIGVNNYGTFPFKKAGNLKKAISYTNAKDFKILLSHDPKHWKLEVAEKTDIALTLSGHTHAMQIAIITKLFRMSPSWFVYKNWYGPYEFYDQKLYVNPGLGYSGFSGRIGIRPEITLITLHRSK